MGHELQLFLRALQSQTRVPVPGWVGTSDDGLQASVRHLPGVGLLIGGLAALLLWAAAHLWPALVSVLLSLAFAVWLTRGLHEEGLARAGGVLALLLVLALKAAAWHGLATRDLLASLAVLPLAHAWSRTALVVVLRQLPAGASATDSARRPQAKTVDGLALWVALFWAGLAAGGAAFFLPADALWAAAAACVAVTLAAARGLQPRRGPGAADVTGATQQFSELATYLAVLAALSAG